MVFNFYELIMYIKYATILLQYDETPLHIAVVVERSDIVKCLVEDGHIDITRFDKVNSVCIYNCSQIIMITTQLHSTIGYSFLYQPISTYIQSLLHVAGVYLKSNNHCSIYFSSYVHLRVFKNELQISFNLNQFLNRARMNLYRSYIQQYIGQKLTQSTQITKRLTPTQPI